MCFILCTYNVPLRRIPIVFTRPLKGCMTPNRLKTFAVGSLGPQSSKHLLQCEFNLIGKPETLKVFFFVFYFKCQLVLLII